MPVFDTVIKCTSGTRNDAIRPSTNGENPSICTICLEPLTVTSAHKTPPHDALTEPAVTIKKCGHVFGRDCLEQWMRNSNTCPMCRIEIFPMSKHKREGDEQQPASNTDVPHFALGAYAGSFVLMPNSRERIIAQYRELMMEEYGDEELVNEMTRNWYVS
ncbi:hypothetical protein P153DRAFT_217257 [Dothidotthia symphoricarpi CBS 119687]|uniref:RING-type domain-containing protein n=1 Tax=Dothidotthia symphoricarpi CBS 119687 TaxID=1392245 RepID=A0A6A6AEM0_9PLEO|nr:uncharacterized protein P153DRAFT_217257 [Dothidotthia symphoricarpi CBS 119687]KAF2130402.1 hypothetical protein P153DRAFT_217257 [Dothidotthia symphoricarpi CBS 119687]